MKRCEISFPKWFEYLKQRPKGLKKFAKQQEPGISTARRQARWKYSKKKKMLITHADQTQDWTLSAVEVLWEGWQR